jgi:thiamine pyrophosphate-dependent acetolactate synthase large subunit-like protein
LFAGTIGLTQHDPAYALLDESDCIVAIGLDAVELVKVWNQPQPLIWIAHCENQNPRLPSEIELIAPIGDVLERLNELLQHAVQSLDWGVNRVQVFREKVEAFSSPVPLSSQRISPMEVIETVREHTP